MASVDDAKKFDRCDQVHIEMGRPFLEQDHHEGRHPLTETRRRPMKTLYASFAAIIATAATFSGTVALVVT